MKAIMNVVFGQLVGVGIEVWAVHTLLPTGLKASSE